MSTLPDLRRGSREIFTKFLHEYELCGTYWYIPKARTLSGEQTIKDIQGCLKIILEEFLDEIWNQSIQDELLFRLIEEGILKPYTRGTKQDRTALTRIHKKLWERLGFVWIEDNHQIIITDAGLDFLSEQSSDVSSVIEGQIAKWQYPNPSTNQLASSDGLLPHLFLIQVLQQVEYKISRSEFDLFINLADSQSDLHRVVQYIVAWRQLNPSEQRALTEVVKEIPMSDPPSKQGKLFGYDEIKMFENRPKRYNRIHLNSSYQRAFYVFPHYLGVEGDHINSTSEREIDDLVTEKIEDLKISTFRNKADWFSYYGDPKQQPSWFTYLSLEIERAESQQEAVKLVKEGRGKLKSNEEIETIERMQIEKGIEDFYVQYPSKIEDGLELVDYGNMEGRQYSTPIGSIDLLCKDQSGVYVVVEIKAHAARDLVFGQILRYIGWIHRNMDTASNNVRGIILASDFPDKARYSRIGLELLSNNYEEFLKFKKHGFNLQDT